MTQKIHRRALHNSPRTRTGGGWTIRRRIKRALTLLMHTAKQLLPAKDNVRNTENTSVSLRMYAGISKVTSSGQITIPAEIRRKKKIEAGCSLLLIDTDDVIIVKKVDESKDVFDSFDKRMQLA